MITNRLIPCSSRDCRRELDNYSVDQKCKTHQARSCTVGRSTTGRKPIQHHQAKLREGVFAETQSRMPGILSPTRKARKGVDELLRLAELVCNELSPSLFPPITY